MVTGNALAHTARVFTVTVGTGFTVAVTGVLGPGQPLMVHST